MNPDELLALFEATSEAIGRALETLDPTRRRARTPRPGQYLLDLVADKAALTVLAEAPVAVVSEESGRSGPAGAPVTVVIDPVDGLTNASRGVPYWGTSLCALDASGPLVALVVNQATGLRSAAVRGRGAWRDGKPTRPSSIRRLEESVVAVSGHFPRPLPWRQYRALGSAALAMCDVAGGVVEAFVDSAPAHAPWDYLGGLLVCSESGAVARDVAGRPLVEFDASSGLPSVDESPAGRRQLAVAAGSELFEAVLSGIGIGMPR
ncbi:MAG: inositol monophosphatase family protein [Acidimicrobiia bacterium]